MQKTKKIMNILENNPKSLQILVDELKAEYPIIIPTDTNYNLACLPESNKAIDLIFEYKKRAKDKPLSLFFLNPNDWTKYGSTKNNTLMELLVKEFFPGPLNIVVENTTNYSYMLNGNSTIALGCLENPTWRKLMEKLNSPIAITSANISGTADNMLITEDIALEQMGEKVKFMLRSENEVLTTKSSTIVSLLEENKVIILREGDISARDIELIVGDRGYLVEKY